MKRIIVPFLLTALALNGAFALDFSLRPGGFLFFPLGEPAKTRYGMGGGGDLLFDLDLSSIWPNPLGLGYTAGIEGGMNYAPLSGGAEGSLALYSAGAGLSLYYYPLSRLLVRLDGATGVYAGVLEDSRTPAAWWWRVGGGIGFRFTPSFVISANAGGRYYNDQGGALHSGLYTGLTVQFNVETRASAGEVEAAVTQDEGVFPAYLSLYQNNPVGTLRIRNNENAELRNVRVSYRAGAYTASEFSCGTIPLIPKGRTAKLPLYADFSPAVLNFTDNGRVLGELVIRYSFLGKERQITRNASVQVHHRNTFPPGDMVGLAAFVSPTSPEILEYAKYITGLARTNRRTALNQNMQFGIWLFEGLRASGVKSEAYTDGPDLHGSSFLEVQFPVQTLAYRSGSAIDAGLLFAGALEAAGISAAIIPLEDDFITAFSLGINKAAAETLFNGLDKILVIDDEVWLPVSMGADGGFVAAWEKGAEGLTAFFESGAEADFIILEKAWASYPPAPLPAQGMQFSVPEAPVVLRNAGTAIDGYVNAEIEPLIGTLQTRLRTVPAADLYNRLGILLVRAGRTAEAKAACERAAGMGLAAAMANRGNMALLENDYTTAEKWFKQALAASPENEAAKRGMEKIQER